MPESKNIVLVDDHIVIRNGLKELIEKLGQYKVTGQFDGGQAFLDAWPTEPAPDLIVMDLSMPGMNGDELMEILAQKQVKTPVLVLTLNEDEQLVVKLFRLGARGYLRKNCTAVEMKTALEEIFSKGYYHNEFLAHSLVGNNNERSKPVHEMILEQLSPREKEFLKLVCHESEYTYKEIANLMNVEPRTVDGYRESVFVKFDIKSKTGLVLFVLKHRLYEHL